MARVAVVTGGTRGIGVAVSKALAAQGDPVAGERSWQRAGGGLVAAETGVPTYKMDVADDDACVAGLARIAKDIGPVEVLVNNAGITRDGMFHKMTPEQRMRGHQHQPQLAVQHVPAGHRGNARAQLRPHRQHLLDQRAEGPEGQVNYSAAKAGSSASPRRSRKRAPRKASP